MSKFPRIARIFGELLELEEGHFVRCTDPDYKKEKQQARDMQTEPSEHEEAVESDA